MCFEKKYVYRLLVIYQYTISPVSLLSCLIHLAKKVSDRACATTTRYEIPWHTKAIAKFSTKL